MRRGLVLILAFLPLPACHVIKPPPAATTVASSPVSAPRPPVSVAVRKTTVERLSFRVDPSRSSGRIETTLDPYRLGPRSSQCECPLRGNVSAQLTSRPDGTRSLRLDRIKLVTTGDGRLSYDWSPLIGSVTSVIPSGRLAISRNTIPSPLRVDPHGRFEQPGCRFSVKGVTNVTARGLILKRKVGTQLADLSLDQTDAVKLAGSLIRRDGSWVLHVPAAVLTDRFELDDDGSTLDFSFTASITAVAQ